jgi:hypothetical protein
MSDWKIVRKARGKETTIQVGSRSQLTNRLKQLRDGTKGKAGRHRKYPVQYDLVKNTE